MSSDRLVNVIARAVLPRNSPLPFAENGVISVPSMRVSIRNLTKRFGDTVALKNVSVEIQSQELFFLLGPSGCGKTTLLRLIAGFYQPDGGDLFFGDKSVSNVPP